MPGRSRRANHVLLNVETHQRWHHSDVAVFKKWLLKVIQTSYITSIYFILFLCSFIQQEYVLWNAVSVPLLQFARYCCRGHVTLATPTFRKLLSGVTSGLSLGTRLPNLKFISSAVLELLAFNAQKFLGSRYSSHAPFYHIFTFRGWRLPRHVVWTMEHYNRSIDNVREEFQVSHWKCITWVPIWGKIG